MSPRATWFLPSGSTIARQLRSVLIIAMILPLTRIFSSGAALSVKDVVVTCAAMAGGVGLVLLFGVLLFGVRASVAGIHELSAGLIAWSCITSATFDGATVRFEIAPGEHSDVPSSGSFELTRPLRAALLQWLAAEHPIRRAIAA